jgi:acyl transferase domain-containing protein
VDPQRLLLEVAWKEDAAQGRENLFGRQVGVFIGIRNADMPSDARLGSFGQYRPLLTTGNVFSTAAGAYPTGLTGPQCGADTACPRPRARLACQSLRAEESVYGWPVA